LMLQITSIFLQYLRPCSNTGTHNLHFPLPSLLFWWKYLCSYPLVLILTTFYLSFVITSLLVWRTFRFRLPTGTMKILMFRTTWKNLYTSSTILISGCTVAILLPSLHLSYVIFRAAICWLPRQLLSILFSTIYARYHFSSGYFGSMKIVVIRTLY